MRPEQHTFNRNSECSMVNQLGTSAFGNIMLDFNTNFHHPDFRFQTKFRISIPDRSGAHNASQRFCSVYKFGETLVPRNFT